MQQEEILSIAERLIPAYHSEDFDFVLSQVTEGEPPSAKLLVKMELNRIMAPCTKTIDLRGRVQGDCREYELDGLRHWLDDVAFNAYHKNTKKFGGYTEGVWEALINTRNNFRVMQQRGQTNDKSITNEKSPFEAEPIHLGYDLKRLEKRLKVQTQVEIKLSRGQLLHGLSIDLSSSGAKFKVPSAFNYTLGEVIKVTFTELGKTSAVLNIERPIEFRVIAVDESYENDAVKFLRTIKLSDTNVVDKIIDESLNSDTKRNRHDNQDKIIRARTRGYEHTHLKHTCNLPLFFSGSELKVALLTPNNMPTWQYFHDERNQQVFGGLLSPSRMEALVKPGVTGSNNVIYTFTHEHEERRFFYSMMMPEANRDQRQLFWHLGAKRRSWRAFRISVFELSEDERRSLANYSDDLGESVKTLTHCGILQEIANHQTGTDYLFTEKPRLPSSELNRFRQSRKIIGTPKSVYFDATSRRKEPRFHFKSPIEVTSQTGEVFSGSTRDLSKRGMSIVLNTPADLKAGDDVTVNLRELQLYDKNHPLDKVPYQVIRVGPNGKSAQLLIDENSKTIRTIAFFNGLIQHNQAKLKQQQEVLPSNELLEALHSILLSKMVSSPIFIHKAGGSLHTSVIGVNFPLEKHLMPLAKLGHNDCFSLEPIFKGHSNTLIANPIKRIEGAEPQHHEIYISIMKFGERIKSIECKLHNEFDSVKQRIMFVKKAKLQDGFFAVRLSTAPIFDPMTTLMTKDLSELTQFSMHQAGKLEKELSALIGYCELEDITEEILIRLGLTG